MRTLKDWLAMTIEGRQRALQETLSRLDEADKKYCILINHCLRQGGEGEFSFIPYIAKDNISTKGIETTGGSALLAGYVPPFDATIIKRLDQLGATLIGKSNLDELAVGGRGVNPFYGTTRNPLDPTRLAGGSSSGSAAAVACGLVPFALGTDTGDSIRKPASNVGIVGFKPSFGLISRFGVFPFACSMDHVGFFTSNVADAAYLTWRLSGRDEDDITSKDVDPAVFANLTPSVKGRRLLVIPAIVDACVPAIRDQFWALVDKLRRHGAIVEEVEVDHLLLEAILPTYLILSCGEANSNNANLQGLSFGARQAGSTPLETMLATRTKGFGHLIKRRFMIGSYVLGEAQKERLFVRAQKMRRLLCDWYLGILALDGALILPASPDVAPLIEAAAVERSPMYIVADNYMALSNFSGTPSITIKGGWVAGLPFGINISSAPFTDADLLDLAAGVEELVGGGDNE